MPLTNDAKHGQTGAKSANKTHTLSTYNTDNLPSASENPNRLIVVSDGNNGSPCLAWSAEGQSWIQLVAGPDVSVPRTPAFFEGFNFFSYWEGHFSGPYSTDGINRQAEIGSNAISIVPTWFTSTTTSSDIFPNVNSEPDSGVIKACQDGVAAGLAVLVKPHIDIANGAYRGNFVPADPVQWFANYKVHILRYAAIAQNNGACALSVGCELASISGPAYRGYWIDIIHAVRSVFKGKITYASDWGETKTVSFWDAVDIIGIDAYVPLSTASNPSVADIAAGWSLVPSYPEWAHNATNDLSPIVFYQTLSAQYGKPVMFTELGYRNDDDAAKDPGIWSSGTPRNDEMQRRCYQAYFDVFPGIGAWFIGAQFWAWFPEPDTNIGAKEADVGFSPQTRIAEAAIESGFASVNVP